MERSLRAAQSREEFRKAPGCVELIDSQVDCRQTIVLSDSADSASSVSFVLKKSRDLKRSQPEIHYLSSLEMPETRSWAHQSSPRTDGVRSLGVLRLPFQQRVSSLNEHEPHRWILGPYRLATPLEVPAKCSSDTARSSANLDFVQLGWGNALVLLHRPLGLIGPGSVDEPWFAGTASKRAAAFRRQRAV